MPVVNDAAIDLICESEGFVDHWYPDPAHGWKVPTCCYGHTDAAGEPKYAKTKGHKFTAAEGRAILAKDLDAVSRSVLAAVAVPLTDNQFAALVSLAFNIGEGAFAGSTLLKVLNAGRYDEVPAQLMKWTKVGKKVVQGLVNRRAAECGLWAKGSFVASNTVVPEAPKAAPGKGGVLGGAAVVVVGTIGAAQQITEATQKLGDTIAPSFGDYAPYVTPAVLFIVLVGFGVWWLTRAHKRQQEAA